MSKANIQNSTLSSLGLSPALTTTTVQATTYTAGVNQLIPCDATSAAFTITLPTAPVDKSKLTVKKVDISTNIVTIASTGSDVFNKASGVTSLTLSLLNQSLTVQYNSSTSIWYVVGDDLPLSQMDGRYAPAGVSTNSITSTVVSAAGSSQSLAATQAGESYYDLTLSASTCTLYLSGGSTGHAATIKLILRQDSTGGRLVTFNPAVTFPDGTTPVLTATPGAIDMFTLTTPDGGTTWVGGLLGPDSGALFTQAAADARYPRTVNGTAADTSGNITIATSANGGTASSMLGANDIGLKALTIDPRTCTSTRAMVAGILACYKAKGIAGAVLTGKILLNVTTAGVTYANTYFAFYDQTGAQLATTANIAGSAPFTLGSQSVTIPTFTIPSDGVVIIGILIGSASTLPVLTSGGGAIAGLTWGQDGTKGYPYFNYGSGLTSPPSSLTLNSTNCTIAAPGASAVLLALL